MITKPSGTWPPVKIGDLVKMSNTETGSEYMAYCSRFDKYDSSFLLVFFDDGQTLEYFMDDMIERRDGTMLSDDGRLNFVVVSSDYQDSAG